MPPLKCISPHKSAPCLKNFEPEDFFKMIEQNRHLLTSSLKGDLVGLYRCAQMMSSNVSEFRYKLYNPAIYSRNDWGTHTHTHTRLTAPCAGLPGWAGTRKVKPVWILLDQETVSGSGISWAICFSTSLQTDNHASTPLSVFYRPDALPAAQPTASKHWRV